MSLPGSARRWLPWLLSIALVVFVFLRVPFAEAWSAAREARLEIFLPLVLGCVTAWFLLESAGYALLFSRLNAPLRFREARSLRALGYLLTPIHWNLGKAFVVLQLHARKQVPLLEVTSTMVLAQTIDAVVLSTLALLGLAFLPAGVAPAGASLAIATLLGVLCIGLALIRSGLPGERGLLARLRGAALLRSHRRIGPGALLAMVVLKTAYFGVFVVFYSVGARAFGVELPLALVLATAPIIQAIGALPIAPAGLGTQQAAMLYFFGQGFGATGSDAAIVAFGFGFPIAVLAARCLLGAVYLARAGGRSSAGATVRGGAAAQPPLA